MPDTEDIQAAGDMYDSLIDGTFYDKQEAAHKWLRDRPGQREFIRMSLEGK